MERRIPSLMQAQLDSYGDLTDDPWRHAVYLHFSETRVASGHHRRELSFETWGIDLQRGLTRATSLPCLTAPEQCICGECPSAKTFISEMSAAFNSTFHRPCGSTPSGTRNPAPASSKQVTRTRKDHPVGTQKEALVLCPGGCRKHLEREVREPVGVARRVHGVPKSLVKGHRKAISTYTRRDPRRSMAGKLRGRLRTPAFCARTRAPRDFPRRNYVFGSVAIGATATLPKGEPQ
jgi:hypothetical protein